MIPFKDIHEQIIINTPEPYVITIMRRMMYRIASMIAKINDCKVLISGDSIGQVASQTIESMVTIQNVTDTLIIRPLAAFDKFEIIKIAKKIDTFTISNRPFSDCCTVYVPKNPVIRPDIEKAEKYEEIYDYKPLIDKVINEVITIQIDARKHLVIQSKGLTVKEAFDNLNKEF